MKNLLIASLVTLASVLGVTDPVFSQNVNNFDVAGTDVVTGPVKSRVTGYASINPKAMRDFRNSYANVNNEIWVQNKNGFMALFTSDEIRFKVEYDNKGNWYATEKAYPEKKLQSDIRTTIKRAYFDYAINWITEINMPDDFTGTIYVVQMQDEKSYKSICLYEGEIKTIDEYSKSNQVNK